MSVNPETIFHPHYELTDEMKKLFPVESEKWEKLLEDVRDPSKKGCFTCQFYEYPHNEFVEVEWVNDCEVPWDTEAACVDCDKSSVEAQSSLRIECPLWELYLVPEVIVVHL